MKILDEKGRLFGKINLIDFLVIMLLVLSVPMLYFGYKILIKKPTPEVKHVGEFVEIELDCRFEKVKPEALKHISVGDQELNEFGQVVGKIMSLGQTESYNYSLSLGEGQKLIYEDPTLKQIEARLRLKAEVTPNNQIYYNDVLITSGKYFRFKTDKYNIAAATPIKKEVVELKGSEDETIDLSSVSLELDCLLIKVEPDTLEKISIGDRETDKDGKVEGRIVSLGHPLPYQYWFDLGQGQKILKKDPILKQIEAKLRLRTAIKGNETYYKGTMLKLALPFEFTTDNYRLTVVPVKKIIVRLEERVVDLYVTLKDLDEEALKEVAVGDKELGENDEAIAEILSLGKIESSLLEFNLGSGNFVMGEDSVKKQISTKMRLKCQVRDGRQLFFKGRKVERNEPVEFQMGKYKAIGVVAKTFEITPPIKEKWLSLRVRLAGLAPEIANAIQKGDREKDVFDKTVGRISSVISNNPSQVLTIKQDEFVMLSHPYQKDILLSLEVLCIEKEGIYYFKNYPVKMGNNIAFSTDMYAVSGEIIGMEIR